MRKQVKKIFVTVIIGVLSWSNSFAADPSVTIDSVSQRYPWNGMVDFQFTIVGDSGTKYSTSFVAKDVGSGTNIVMSAIIKSDGSIANVKEELLPGTYNWVWNAQDDLPCGWQCERVTVMGTAVAQFGGVQLWANGPYWAECNVGASKPEECGYYFWWGDTVGYKRNANNDGWVSVADGSSFSFTGGNTPTYGKDNSSLLSAGYIDSTGNLVAKYDAATAHLGSPWRMPTADEIDGLVNNCTTTWTTRNGVYGRLVTGKGDYASKSIFLPAVGDGRGSDLNYSGSYGGYWSSTPTSDHSYDAWHLYFISGVFSRSYGSRSRNYGRPVRAVRGFAQ